MRGKRVLTWLLALALTAGLTVVPAPEAEAASDDYKGWTQEDSRWGWTVMGPPDKSYTALGYQAYTNQIPYLYYIGCTTTALAKIMVQAGCEDPSTFNPGVLAKRLNAYGSDGKSGYINYWQDGQASLWGSLRDFARPANEVPNFQYIDSTTLTNAGILSSVKAGYYMVVRVVNPLGNFHWVAIDNELTLKNNTVMIMDTGNPGTGVYNISLASRYPLSSYFVVRYKTKGPYTVSFNANGGVLENAESKKLNPGDQYGLLPVPTRKDDSGNYIFRGWSTDAEGNNLVGDLDTFTAKSDQVLYAQWNINIRESYLIEEAGEVVKRYTPIAYAVSREQARRICEASGGNLLDVRTEIDEIYLDLVCTYPDEELWVGLSRNEDDEWVWDTGAALEEELPWGENEPGEGDAVYYDTTARTLHTADGDAKARYFIYEWGEDRIPTTLSAELRDGEEDGAAVEVTIKALKEDGYLFTALYDEAGAFLGAVQQNVEADQSRAEVSLPARDGAANAKVFLLDKLYVPLTESVPVHIDETRWSLWQEDCNADEAAYEIEERTLYRSRTVKTKEYVDTLMDGSYDPGEGWVLVDQDMILKWTEGLTTTTKPEEAWNLEITGERTLYKYQHWHNTYDGTNLNIDSIAHGSNCAQCTWSTPTKLTQTFPALTDQGGKTAYTCDHYCGSSIVSRNWWFENGTETEYTYRTAEFVGVHSYYERYGSWSLWQEEAIEEEEGLAVEKRTEYRWRLRGE